MTTTIKEKPILFSAPMVRAILAGRKTMTRRVVTDRHFKRLGLERDGEYVRTFDGPQWDGTFESGSVSWCPYGPPGSHLWVKETWTPDHRDFYPHFPVVHKADAAFDYERNEKGEVYSPEQKSWYPYRWRSSRYMPRWASRITLQVEAVRVERLQEITEIDAQSEGVDWPNPDTDVVGGKTHPTCIDSFRVLWEKINGPESWDANPFVWCVSFSVVKS